MMKKIINYSIIYTLLLILTFILPLASSEAIAQTPVQRLAKDNNTFTFNLYSQLKSQKGNIFFSPYSISTALSMTYAGAKGNTEKEISKALNYKIPQSELHKNFFELSKQLKLNQQPGIELNIANAIWLQKDYTLLKSFTDSINKYYGAGVKKVDFKNATEASRKQINSWVEEQTKTKIKDLIKPNILTQLTTLVLTNAIYFKGNWSSKFKKENTKNNNFKLTKNKEISVPFMYQKNDFNYWEGNDLQIIELPYAGKKLSMLILLPKETEGLTKIESKINSDQLNTWMHNLQSVKVDLYLPKFKTTSQFSIAEKLKALGMKDAFSEKANFSGISGKQDLFISAILHKAFVDVNEEGTEAAAATAVVMARKSIEMPVSFKADHPFLFFIKDNSSGSILFMGRLSDPTK